VWKKAVERVSERKVRNFSTLKTKAEVRELVGGV
jgi:hypothetical protein